MADIRNTSVQGLADFAGSVKSVRTFGGEVRVMVASGSAYESWIRKLYRAMVYAHTSTTMTSELPFTEDEFVSYCVDALHVRVQRVRREPSALPFQGWAIPAALGTMLAGLGEVTHEAPYVRIVPTWPEDISWNLNRLQWNELTVRIRSVEATMSVLLIDTIERDPKGRDEIMSLLPQQVFVDGAEEEEMQVDTLNPLSIEAVYRSEPVDAISAATYLILGLLPEETVDPTLLHPLARPGYKMDYEVIALVVDRLAQVKSA